MTRQSYNQLINFQKLNMIIETKHKMNEFNNRTKMKNKLKNRNI